MKRKYSKPFDRAMYLLDFLCNLRLLTLEDGLGFQWSDGKVTKADCAYALECSLPTAITALELLIAWGMVDKDSGGDSYADRYGITGHGQQWYKNHLGFCLSAVRRYQMIIDHNRMVVK